jgi:ribosomal protein L40E
MTQQLCPAHRAQEIAARLSPGQKSTIRHMDETFVVLGCSEATALRLSRPSRSGTRPALTQWKMVEGGEYAAYKHFALTEIGLAVRAHAEPDYYTKPAEAILGDSVICLRCSATLATYADACTADLGDQCPGFVAIEAAVAQARAQSA